MLKVGISGKIASGKSEVENILRALKYPVFDLDEISRGLFENNETIRNKIKKEFQTLDRKAIAKIIFKDENKRQILENVIHPLLKERIFEIFEEYKDEKVLFISGALLFKSGFYKFFDKTIYVDAKDEIRINRLMKRNNLTMSDAKARICVQDEGDLADFVVENNESEEMLENEVKKVLKALF